RRRGRASAGRRASGDGSQRHRRWPDHCFHDRAAIRNRRGRRSSVVMPMTPHLARRRAGAIAAAVLLSLASPASAQSWFAEHVGVEFVGAVTTSSPTPTDPFILFDGTATVRLTSTVDVIVRPWFRRLPGGDWSSEMYQLQLRYQPPTRLPVRLDAGIISSP